MAESYYIGDNVPLKFKITDAEGDIEPSVVKVIIAKPSNRGIPTSPANADIDGNTVSYKVPTSVTTDDGEYHAFFVCTISAGIRTYQMNFYVYSNPR